MKNYADLGGCYPPQPSASADNTLLDLHNSSYHTQPHPIIVNYFARRRDASNCTILTVSRPIYAKYLAPNVWLHRSVGRASHRYSRRPRVRIPLLFAFVSYIALGIIDIPPFNPLTTNGEMMPPLPHPQIFCRRFYIGTCRFHYLFLHSRELFW